ncbi:MAG: hypothetical protein AB2826_24215 [Candidatus Thiodiazotropha sp.]
MRRLDTRQGSLRRSLWRPIDQTLEKCLSIWTEPCTNRSPFGFREHIAAQPRPLFRQWMTTKDRPWMRLLRE